MPTLRADTRIRWMGARERHDLKLRQAQYAMERRVVRALLKGLGVSKWLWRRWAKKTLEYVHEGRDRMTFSWLHEWIGGWPVQMISLGLPTKHLQFHQWNGDLTEIFHPRSRKNQLVAMWRHANGTLVRQPKEFPYLACVFDMPKQSPWEGATLVMHNVILPALGKPPVHVRYFQWRWGFILEDIRGFAAWLPLFFELHGDSIRWRPEAAESAKNAPRWIYNYPPQEHQG